MSSSKDYKIAAEPDLGTGTNKQIWIYLVLLGVSLFVTIAGLTIMFRFQVDYEEGKKVGKVRTQEALEQEAISESYLSGKKGLFADKKNVSIDDAMDRFLTEIRRAD